MSAMIDMALTADIGLLARLHGACFDVKWNADSFAEMLAVPVTTAWIARCDGKATGFALLRAVAGEGEIPTLGVLPAWRGQGMGQALVVALQQWAKDHALERLFLEVRESNGAALALYRKSGFTQIGLRRGYYASPDGIGEHAIVMRCTVNPT